MKKYVAVAEKVFGNEEPTIVGEFTTEREADKALAENASKFNGMGAYCFYVVEVGE